MMAFCSAKRPYQIRIMHVWEKTSQGLFMGLQELMTGD
jgi:hypothetical protein